MIEAKQTYRHTKSDLQMKILNESPMHKYHWHVGLIQNGEIIMTCHVHRQDIEDDWDRRFDLAQQEN